MSVETVLSFEEATRNLRTHESSRWANVAGEFETGVLPAVSPSFELQPGEEVFTIGSCFARNIEAHLARLGCRIPMMDFDLPATEWHGLPNQALNKFTPPTFRQTLEWTARILRRDGKVRWKDCELMAFDCGDGQYFDQELAAPTSVTRERFLERRQQVYDVTRTAFTAGCVIMTPGLVEGWRDRQTGFFISGAGLKHKSVRAAGTRFELVVLDYNRCFQDLHASIELIRSFNPHCKILISTSPVPLAATFSGHDVRVANTYSKSVLRAACGALADAGAEVDYFPSYESVVLTEPGDVWQTDRIHVRDDFVGRIVARLVDTYVSSVDAGLVQGQLAATALAARDFDKAAQHAREALAARPDDTEARLVLADALLAQSRMQEAVEVLETLPDETSRLSSVRLRLARAVFAADPRRAIELGLAACEAPDAHPRAVVWTSRAMGGVNTPADTRERLLKAGIARFPHNIALGLALSDLLEGVGRLDEAQAELRRIDLSIAKPADREAVRDRLTRLGAAEREPLS